MTVDGKYYSVQAAAETLAVDDEQILSFIHSGHLRAANMAKANSKRPRWRIAEADLGRFLLSRLHPASAAQPSRPAKSNKRSKPTKEHV